LVGDVVAFKPAKKDFPGIVVDSEFVFFPSLKVLCREKGEVRADQSNNI